MSSCLERQYYLGKGEITRIAAGLGRPGPIYYGSREYKFQTKEGFLIFWEKEIRQIEIIENNSDSVEGAHFRRGCSD